MALNNFFTLAELNNGLTSPSRVRELVAAMQLESPAQHDADSTSLWSTVAAAIAATDEKECLDLFIQLDGLHFFNNWLNCALNSENTFVEGLTLLVKALEKLPVDYEKLAASGILITVENLLAHNSFEVQEKARDVYQKWKKNSDGNTGASSNHAVGITEGVGSGKETSERGVSLLEVNVQESNNGDPALATCSEGVDVEVTQSMGKSLDAPTEDNRPLDGLAVLETTCVIKHNAEITVQEKPVTSCSDATDGMKSEVAPPEVEGETINYKEQSCSSEKVEVGNAPRLGSPDITNKKESPASEGSAKHVEIDEIYTAPVQEDSAASAKTLDAEQTNATPDVESSQVTETAVADEINNSEKEVIGTFDLNTLSTASPRRMLENDIASSSGSSIKQQKMGLDIDLNIAQSYERGEESCLGTNSRLDTNSRKYKHLELDLNHASEDDGPSDWQTGQLFPQGNGHQSRSHSSSSSVWQPPVMNFDPNGQPSFLSNSSKQLSQNHSVSEGLKSDGSYISIMGTRVQVDPKPEVGLDLNLGRSRNNGLGFGTALPYSHSPFYGYNNIGLASEPVPVLSHSLYEYGGPIPYMVDSRGTPVIPHLLDSGSGYPRPPFFVHPNSSNPSIGIGPSGTPVIPHLLDSGSGYPRPPFFVHPNSSNPSIGIGPSSQAGSNFNLNYGMVVESGRGEPVGFRQFLSSGHVGPMGELRPNPQPHFGVNPNSSNPSSQSGSSFNPNYGMVVESGSGEHGGFRQFLSSGHVGPVGEQMRPPQPHFGVIPNSSNPSSQSGSSFNPNYGMVVESGGGDHGGFRQFLSSGHIGPMGEQMRPNPHQPPASSVGGKRKVPEADWANYPPRQYRPPHKE